MSNSFRRNRRPILMFMLTVLMNLSCLMLQAQNLKKENITLSCSQETLENVLQKVTQITSYEFLYDESVLKSVPKVSLQLKDASLQNLLDALSKQTNLHYKVSGKTILISKSVTKEPVTGHGTHSVSGVVEDETGVPIIGANITVKGTTNGTMTNIDGQFTLQDVPANGSLVISYIGYKSITLPANSKNLSRIVLKEDTKMIDEVVVVGYGTQRKANLTGAVSIIDSKNINERPVVSAAGALQGADPAVNLTFGTGSPESGYSVNVRGAISINSSSPLVLADGMEVSLNQINPNDIESISILKDASSCAIYGAKASAGVILITTKKGKTDGKVKVQYNGRYGWAQNTTSTDFITTGYDHVVLTNRFYKAYNGVERFKYTEANGGLEKLYERRNDKTENPDRPWCEMDDNGNYMYYGNTDWYNYYYNKTRPQQEHNISVNGGNDKVNVFASGRYLQQYGIFKIKKDNYQDYSFRAKMDAKIRPWLRYSANVNYDKSGYSYAGNHNYQNTIASLQSNISPAFIPYNPDGTIVQYSNQLTTSPLGAGYGGYLTANTARNNKETRNSIITNQLVITLFKDLVLTASYGYRQRDRLYKYRNNTFDYSRKQNEIKTFTSGSVENSYREVDYKYHGQNVNIYGTYTHNWKDHHFKAVAGGQYDSFNSRQLDIYQKDLSNDKLASFAVATGEITAQQSLNAYRTLGFFGRVNYDYNGKYLLEVSARGDGSSRFAPSDRWGFFPSVSAGWRISEEKFFEPLSDVWDNCKIRFSVGSLGNQQVSNYAYIEQLSIDNIMDYTFDDISKANYASISAPISSGLTWETITTYDLGFDWGFLRNRLSTVADFYIRDTKDMLTTSLTLPSVFGAKTPKANCADLRTKGWEVSVNWNDEFKLLSKPFSYGLSASIGDYVTKITKYCNPNKVLSDYYEGMTLGEIWGYKVDGLFKTDKEAAEYQSTINDAAVNQRVYKCKLENLNKLRAGDVRFHDNGDNVISKGAGTVDNPGDLYIIGNTLPRYSYSFRLNANWYGFDVSAFFQGVGKRNWYPANGQSAYDFWGPYAFPTTSFIHRDFYKDCWTEENQNTYFPRQRGYQAYSGGSLGETNDRYLQDVSYLRFKNLMIGYTLPVWKKYLDSVRFYFSGENLYYWSPFKKHCKTIDPELTLTSSTKVDNSGTGYGYSRIFSFGVDIKF